MPILVELPRICLSSLVNVCFPKCVDSHMHVRFARPSFASDIDNLSVTAVPFVTGTDWNHSESDESHESGAMDWKLYPSLFVSHVVRYLQRSMIHFRGHSMSILIEQLRRHSIQSFRDCHAAPYFSSVHDISAKNTSKTPAMATAPAESLSRTEG